MARFGGDEFVVVLPEMSNAAGVSAVAEKLIAAMIQPFQLDNDIAYSASTSIGIALFPNDAADGSQLQQCADSALYEAKAQGRNGFKIFQRHAA